MTHCQITAAVELMKRLPVAAARKRIDSWEMNLISLLVSSYLAIIILLMHSYLPFFHEIYDKIRFNFILIQSYSR